MKTALVWDPSLTQYRFRPDHPFNPKRLELSVSLIEELGLLEGDEVFSTPPRAATEAELLRVHSADYVDAVWRASGGGAQPADAQRWGLGTEDNPVFAGMHEVTALVAGATLVAAELVMTGKATRAFSISGGLHHAHRDRASGFCIYNDLAVAIAWLRAEHDARVLYIDYDAHHGDGVQGLFYDDPDVLTFSIHETGRHLFPGTGFIDELGEGAGFGYSLNLPLEPFTSDASWIGIHQHVLPELINAFAPDVIVLQNGCDGHTLDPLTHLRATTRLYEETVRIVCEAADRVCDGRVIATGGGGYAVWRVVPRAWGLVWAALSGQEPGDAVPRSWLGLWQGESPVVLPEQLRDRPDDYPASPRDAESAAANRVTETALRRAAMTHLRGWSLEF